MIRKGSFTWRQTTFSGGQDSYHSEEEVPDGFYAVMRNLWPEGEQMQLRGGCTAIPTSGSLSATAGAYGLYVWYPDDGGRHIAAAYRGPTNVNVFFVHTAAATALGCDLATSGRVGFAGFGQRLYISDGRGRMHYTDGQATAPVAEIDRPLAAFHTAAGVPYAARDSAFVSYGPGAVEHFPSFYGMAYDSGTTLWGLGTSWPRSYAQDGLQIAGVLTACPDPSYSLRIVATASVASNTRAYAGYRYVETAGYSTSGTWDSVGNIGFWAWSNKPGQFLELRMGPTAPSGLKMPVTFNLTGEWEYKSFDLSHYAQASRSDLGSASFYVTNTSQTFTVFMGPIHRDGAQRGIYEYAPAFYRSQDGAESPLGDAALVGTDDSAVGAHAVRLPPRTTVDPTVNLVRWYRRGEASPEWRRVAEVAAGSWGWDFAADYETADLSPRVPMPAPRGSLISRFGERRMAVWGGYDHGDFYSPLYTGSKVFATSVWTALSYTKNEGLSKGVEIYSWTGGGTAATGRFSVHLQKYASGTFTTQRSVTVNPASLVMRRWNPLYWTSTAASKDSYITQGTAAWRLLFSGMTDCTWNLGCWRAARPSCYNIYDYPDRVWVSRWNRPTYFDRLTSLDAVDEDGFWFELPSGNNERLKAHGSHGSDRLAFTRTSTFYVSGETAADISVVRIHGSIGATGVDPVECDDWITWVSGAKGKARVYAFGPKIANRIWEPAHEKGGFNRIGLAIEPLLNLVTDPAKMSNAYAGGKYHLFFGESVSYRGVNYTGATYDFATHSWATHYVDPTRVRPPRFATTLTDTGDVIFASPNGGTATASNLLWLWDQSTYHKDGVTPITYTWESRHRALPDVSRTRLRGYTIRADQATAGPMTVNAYADGVTAGTATHALTASGAGVRELVSRMPVKAQGAYVGLGFSGTASTDVVIRSIDMYLDRVR